RLTRTRSRVSCAISSGSRNGSADVDSARIHLDVHERSAAAHLALLPVVRYGPPDGHLRRADAAAVGFGADLITCAGRQSDSDSARIRSRHYGSGFGLRDPDAARVGPHIDRRAAVANFDAA